MKRSLIIIFLLLIKIAPAQTSGYLSKRFSIEGNINILPRATEYFLKNEYKSTIIKDNHSQKYFPSRKLNENYQALSLNLKSSISVNYVLSRKIEASLRVTYLQNSFVIQNNQVFDSEAYSNRNDQLLYLSTKEDDVPYSAMEYDFNLKYYGSNFIAPVGKYFLIGIGITEASTIGNGFEISTLISDYYTDSLTTFMIKEKASFIKFNIGMGNKKVYKNNLYLVYETELNLYNGRNRKKDNFDDLIYGSQETFSESIDLIFKRSVRKHIAWDNFLNLKVGIGIII